MKIVIALLSTIILQSLCHIAGAQSMFLDVNNLPKGTRKDTVFQISDSENELELPITIIKGVKAGPTFGITAGIHGFEYPPIVAVQELLAEIDPHPLSGTLIIVPVANTPGFFGRAVFVNPQDGKNLNRAFPGDPNGSITQRLADFITRAVIPPCDVFLDVHGGDANEDLLPFVCYYDRKDTPAQTQLARELTQVAGFAHNVVYDYNLSPLQQAEYAFKQAAKQGITALSIEAGKLGNVQAEAVREIKKGIYNMLHRMDMYAASPSPSTPAKQLWINKQSYVRAPTKGIFYSDAKSGDTISKGQTIGYITNLFGTKMTDIISPETGIILYKVGTPAINRDETLFCIGHE
ncbi:succinylglutamate desuccinylase/aspartoacylase family protein [Olivibacter sitiensis]|uniref:succinylglutamate desuccinylase/aspartoacylase family protein n=1 Tax=Olivibacter sitiensis TaxID=376470 RepID=UPI000481F12A|nr:succinylglutamate desuccinylase/aspartoacylase family protein [Olivibacter sitiensis]